MLCNHILCKHILVPFFVLILWWQQILFHNFICFNQFLIPYLYVIIYQFFNEIWLYVICPSPSTSQCTGRRTRPAPPLTLHLCMRGTFPSGSSMTAWTSAPLTWSVDGYLFLLSVWKTIFISYFFFLFSTICRVDSSDFLSHIRH